MSDLGLRIVEAEPAPCSHLHVSNYDPAKVVQGEPIQVLGNGQMWCYDCKEFFTHPPLPSPSYTLAELRVLARDFLQSTDSGLGVDGVTVRLKLSIFLAWLARREREGRG